jgi:hypothetical protein
LGRYLLLLWVAVAVAFAPLGTIVHARDHGAHKSLQVTQHHHQHQSHQHQSHEQHKHGAHDHQLHAKAVAEQACLTCGTSDTQPAAKDCCQLGCHMILAVVNPSMIILAAISALHAAPSAGLHAGIEPAQADPPPRV